MFVTSAAILVLEILAARLLAPYVGLTLEAYTAIIATVLAGIAAGSSLGGKVADRRDPRRLLGPLVVTGGVLSLATVPVVRALGPAVGDPDAAGTLLLTAAAFFLPAAVLSAVTPIVAKLQLVDLRRTGSVVGGLSAVATGGAIAGTLLAGFVLVEAAATTTSILAIGAALVAGGTALWVKVSHLTTTAAVVGVVGALVVGATGVEAGTPCHRETTYHCARVIVDPGREGGRLLMLDTLRHSYVDLDDPEHLELRYSRAFAAVVDAAGAAGPLEAVHVGGGAWTMARWVAATRPASTNTILEIDRGLVDLVRERFQPLPPDTDVRVGDARTLLDGVAPGSADVVFGDAFGGLAVPWHLTTREAVADIRRVLAPGGIYVLNLIDYPPLRFARAEARTLAEVFGSVAVVAPADVVSGGSGGNLVLVAGDAPFDPDAIERQLRARGGSEQVLVGAAADRFTGEASVLRDEHAPVDQWLARSDRD